MATVVQDVSGDNALQAAIAALKAKIEGAEESSDIAQLVSDISTALAGKQNTLTFDSTPTAGSFNPVTSGGMKTALDTKQDTLIFDTEPTAESTKPVTSAGIHAAVTSLNEDVINLQETSDKKAAAVYDAATGEAASFSDGADDLPMKSCLVNIEPIQEGSGDPSPENVRPISGRTGLIVTRAGKNLLDPSLFKDQTSWNNIAVKVKPDTVYTMSTDAPTDDGLIIYFKNTNTAGGGNASLVYNGQPASIISSSDGYVYVSQRQASGEDSFQNYNYQIEEGSSATEYEPYKYNTYSVNWETEAGTVYGGYVDVVSGKLVVDKVLKEFANSTGWITVQTSNIFRNSVYTPKIKPPASNTVPVDAITNEVNVTKYNHNIMKTYYPSFSANPDGHLYLAISDDVSTLTELSAWLTEHPLQITYKLATPIEYQLAPQEITTLLGDNNIWSDGGTVEVEYPADTKLYIQRLTGSDEDDMVANSNIPDATYFLINNTLYKSTAAIASGDPIVPGTNCTVTNLAEALNALNTTT